MNGITNMIGHSDPLAHVECHQENKKKREQDAAYIVHACNAYPRLVEALRELVAANTVIDGKAGANPAQRVAKREVARALLSELGEDK